MPEVHQYDSLESLPFEKFSKMYFLDSSAQHYFDNDVEYENDLILIGPERGWSDREVSFLEKKGCLKFKISESILRVEFAVNACLSQREYLRNIKELNF